MSELLRNQNDAVSNRIDEHENEFFEGSHQVRFVKYPKPEVTIDSLIFTVKEKKVSNYRKLAQKNLYVLLVKRDEEPFMDQWALPSGCIDLDESLDQASARVLCKETGLNSVYAEQLYTFGDIERDPRSRVISIAYMALLGENNSQDMVGMKDVTKAQWFKIEYNLISQQYVRSNNSNLEIEQFYKLQLVPEDDVADSLTAQIIVRNKIENHSLVKEMEIMHNNGIAFDHSKIIVYGLDRLRNKVEYTDVVFNLMPEEFTLTELQQVYELLLNEKLYAAHFRRKVEPKLILMNDQIKIRKGHRPAKQYKFNPLWQLQREDG